MPSLNSACRPNDAFDPDRFRSGDQSYLRELVDRHSPALLAQARSMMDDDDDARDVVQETWIRAHEARAEFRAEGEFSAWLWAICRSRCVTALERRGRRRAVHAAVALEPLNTPASGASGISSGDHRAVLAQRAIDALALLANRQRQTVWLRLVEGRSTRETASLLQCAEGTVKAALHQALARLANIFEEDHR